MSQINIDTVDRYMKAAYAGDIDLAGTYLTDDVELSMTGSNSLTGVHKGRSGFFAAFGSMMRVTAGTYKLTHIEATLSDDRYVVILAREEAAREGVTYALDRVITFQISDAKIHRVRVYEGDTEAADQAFA